MDIPEKWLEFTPSSRPPHDHIRRIGSLINTLSSDKQKEKCHEYGLYISDKMLILQRAFHHLRMLQEEIYDRTKDYEDSNVFTSKEKGRAIKIDTIIIYDFLLYVDSVVFEMKSLVELIIKYFDKIDLLCNKEEKQIQIDTLQQLKSVYFEWHKELSLLHNHFAHNATPYLAVNISEDKKDIIIKKENIKAFDEKGESIEISKIEKIYSDLYIVIRTIFFEVEKSLKCIITK